MAVINLAAVGAAVAAEIPKIIRDGLEREVLGKANFIADGTPESLPGQIGQAAARSACRQYAAGNSGLTGQAAVNAETACRPYLDDLNPGGSPSVKSPFSGGQCFDVNYSFDFTYTNQQGSRETVSQQTAGRLVGSYVVTLPEDTFQTGFERQTAQGGPTTRVLIATTFSRGNPSPSITNVVRLDGGADNCGNPDPEITQPRQDPDGTPPPFRFNPSPFIDLPINVDINPDGSIAVDIGTGPITVDAFNGDGGGGGGDGGGGGGGAAPGDLGSPGTSAATGNAGEAEGEAPAGQILTGLKVVLTQFPATRTLLENGVYRGAYYAYMGVPGLLDLDPAGAAATLDQFILAEKDNLTAWRLRTNRGYNATVTPYYRTPQ